MLNLAFSVTNPNRAASMAVDALSCHILYAANRHTHTHTNCEIFSLAIREKKYVSFAEIVFVS